MSASQRLPWFSMEFPARLMLLRKERRLTQKALADLVGVHITQIQRYENGSIQPTLDVIRRLATALSVSADVLIFDKDERGPDDDLRLQFEALRQFSPEEKKVAKTLLESLILKHDATRFERSVRS